MTTSGFKPDRGINICIIICMWILIKNTEYFIYYIVTILRIVRSKSQTSIHILGYPYLYLES